MRITSANRLPVRALPGIQRRHVLGLALLLLALPVASLAQDPSQVTFSTPEEAVRSLMGAVKTGDKDQMLAIFGPQAQGLVSSGDDVADAKDRKKFLEEYEAKHNLVASGKDRRILHVGPDEWALPIPIVEKEGKWYFDTAAGKEEILYRRIGRNELGAIEVCRSFVAMQKEYASTEHDGGPAGAYAFKLMSDPGKQNGLYWEAPEGEKQSPAGPLLAEATGEGYPTAAPGEQRSPYHGYFYRVLKAQGPAAPGGAKSYIVEGKMTGGFALVAYPADYQSSGVMTFIVNQQGIVYQQDLGEKTVEIANQMAQYNPDTNWTRVR